MRGPSLVPLLLLLAGAPAARAESLAELLAGVAAEARFAAPARADVRIECATGCRAARAILLGRGDALYVEVKDGVRALVRPGDVRTAADGRAVEAPVDAKLGDTDLLLQDLTVFTADSLRTPQISDDGSSGVIVTGAPVGRSADTLVVLTIDRARRLVVKTQHYRGSISHLASVRTDAEFARLEGSWRPGEIALEDFDHNATTRLRLEWRAAPEAPAGLFQPAGLTRPSGLAWPAD